MLLLKGEIESKSSIDIEVPIHFNTLMYLLDVNGTIVKKKNLFWINNDWIVLQISANENTRFIILSGESIGEKVTSSGPFDMNTQTEIMEAMRDAQMGKMGILIENFD